MAGEGRRLRPARSNNTAAAPELLDDHGVPPTLGAKSPPEPTAVTTSGTPTTPVTPHSDIDDILPMLLILSQG